MLEETDIGLRSARLLVGRDQLLDLRSFPRSRDCESNRSPGGKAATGSAGILPARRREAASWAGQKRISYR